MSFGQINISGRVMIKIRFTNFQTCFGYVHFCVSPPLPHGFTTLPLKQTNPKVSQPISLSHFLLPHSFNLFSTQLLKHHQTGSSLPPDRSVSLLHFEAISLHLQVTQIYPLLLHAPTYPILTRSHHTLLHSLLICL